MNIGSTLVQATNLVLLISNSNADVRKFVVWKKDGKNLTEVLQNMQIERIAVEDTAKVFEHPLETGAVIVDHEVFEPKRATIQAYIANDDRTTLTQLKQLYLSGTILTIRAQNKVIDKVIIASNPHEITGQVFDKTLYSISFREAQEVSPTYAKMPPQKVRNKANASRVNSGVKQAKKQKQSLALGSGKAIIGLIKR